MKEFKKILAVAGATAMVAACMVGVASCGDTSKKENEGETGKNNIKYAISREEGSGTRGAFSELIKKDGTKLESVAEFADCVSVQNSTGAVLAEIANAKTTVGYISMGSVNNTIKTLKFEGVEATTANVTNGTYKLSRPLNIVLKKGKTLSTEETAFVEYIMSDAGQQVVSSNGFIAVSTEQKTVTGNQTTTNIKVGGSSSVAPLMEKLAAAYESLNNKITITVITTDSGSGVSNAINGTYDIGMASRDLKPTELESANGKKIAIDGIALIVNKENSISNVTGAQIYDLYASGTEIKAD